MELVLVAIVLGLLAVVYGIITSRQVLGAGTGNEKMQEIAGAIQEGARAYLNRQYLTIGMVGVVIFVILLVLLGYKVGIGFAIGAYVTGLVAERFAHRMSFVAALSGAVVGGIVVVTICGIIGMAVMMDVSLVTATGFALPFIPGDLIKAGITAAITAAFWKARPSLANAA